MPDVSRSDSQRSDASNKPRVSFNRDVHVKRIVSRDSPHVSGALSSDGAGHLVASPVRKQRLAGFSKKQIAEEAAKVINQADNIHCSTNAPGELPEKFYTLPARRKRRKTSADSPHSSQEHLNLNRRRSEELGVTSVTPPKKPPRTFATTKQTKQKPSLFKLFTKTEKETEPKKSNLRRSVSDASNLKSKTVEKSHRKRSGSESEDNLNNSLTKKKQLSPIIEVSTPKDDYFSVKKDYFNDKENVDSNHSKPPRKKWNKNEAQKGLLNEKNANNSDLPELVIIDVDEAKSINKPSKKLSSQSFKNKFKFLTSHKDKKTNKKEIKDKPKATSTPIKSAKPIEIVVEVDTSEESSEPLRAPEGKTSPKIQETIKALEESIEKSLEMIHSSQQPVEKLPLTRGQKVDNMVRRLNRDKYSPPPKTNTILVTPTVTVAHNNNQPFSYTQPRGISPERSHSRSKSPIFNKPSSPVIYAQVVCGNGDPDNPKLNKQTIHTVYTNNKKQFPHSDSDEGLGYEENTSFSRKYTQFGDEKKHHDIDKFDEEYPITPKFKSLGGGGGFDTRYEYNETFVDSSARGRGDGMDARRRESLTEPFIENGFGHKFADMNGKSDLSHRRDLLESRIKSRRIGDKSLSPEFSSNTYNPRVNKFVQETTSRYYRHGSTSPVGFTENYLSETKVDRNGEKQFTENRSKTVFGEEIERKPRHPELHDDYHNNRYEHFEGEPKSLDSDYRSSPENIVNKKYYMTSHETKDYHRHHHHGNRFKPKDDNLLKDRDHYKSNPEIYHKNYDPSYKYDDNNKLTSETYHDSLRRQKHDSRRGTSPKRNDKYFDSDRDRKDKFGDSGIENDFRRDSGENVRVSRTYHQNYRSNNESEDEGFASSLLIASERQHTEDNIRDANRKYRRDYDSDKDMRNYRERRDEVNGRYNSDYKKNKHDFIHRERSIDDGSHYDPRIDKDLDDRRGTLKVDKKPPKPAKISSLKKMKQLFTRDSNKKTKKDKLDHPALVREESLRARYKEYRGSNEILNRRENYHDDNRRENYSDSRLDNNSDNSQSYDYSNRRRMSTPSPSPTREIRDGTPPKSMQNGKHDSWFKSLDRFSLKKKQSEKIDNKENIEKDHHKPPPVQQKNLRFFGDTDIESNGSVRRKSSLKSRPSVQSYKTPTSTKPKSQSTRNLHNISEEFNHSDAGDTLRKYKGHKSMQNITEPAERDIKGSKSNLKPPISPNRRSDTSTLKSKADSRNRKRRNEVNSVESSTEGDSSQQSQRSVVYLHAATVGDIPGPGHFARNGRRAASKEELMSNGSSRMQTQTKTLSRSFSVLAPWKPRHAYEGVDIDYSQQNSKPVKNMRNGTSKSGGKTAKEIANQKKMSNQNLSTLNRKTKSKENISNSTLNRKSREELSKSSNTTLYKKKDRNFKENNSRYTRDDKKISNKSMSVESLGGGDRSSQRSKDSSRIINRSVSMPRDPEKSAGWFKINKKNKKTLSTQRL